MATLVRPCTAADLEVLEVRWPVPGDVHRRHAAAQDGGATTYLVAWLDDDPVGVGVVQWRGCVGTSARAALPDAIELNHLQVRPDRRGLGIGTALVHAAQDLARGRGFRQLVVGVAQDNDDARRLYERLGFAGTGVVDTSEYDWIDEDGVVHHAVEHDEALLLVL